jgi:hypothetical protein
MAYRLRYQIALDWVGAGEGPMGAQFTPLKGLAGNSGGAQTLGLGNSVIQQLVGSGAGGILQSADITTLTNAMASDISTQLNAAANLALAQGWATGNP